MARLHDYVNEIYDLAEKNHTEPKNAIPMFLTNIEKQDDYYKGAEGTDWSAINLAEMKASTVSFIKTEITVHSEIASLREAGKRAEAKAKMTSL